MPARCWRSRPHLPRPRRSARPASPPRSAERRGIARALLNSIRTQAEKWDCKQIYLTSEPENHAAHATWTTLGFVNVPGDHQIDGVSMITDYKGPGRSRAVYELLSSQ
ncbi:GNAT family N-acetyltransferase [Nocardia australiensis]|uniref:GNAT family N-acetyltransferase n=1 Tax=Nocardia australiensis TaxID=2887191 RepID=UPI001D136EA4